MKVWVRAFGHEAHGFACNTQDCPHSAEYVLVDEDGVKNPYRAVFDCRCEDCFFKQAPKCFEGVRK